MRMTVALKNATTEQEHGGLAVCLRLYTALRTKIACPASNIRRSSRQIACYLVNVGYNDETQVEVTSGHVGKYLMIS